MKKYGLIIFCIVAFNNCIFAQKETISQPKYLEGVTSQAALKQAPYATWFHTNFDSYKLDEATAKEIKKNLKGVTIKAFMGTWCVDSKREIPHFYKLLLAVDFDESNLEMIAVNYAKKTSDNLQDGFNILRVPTFIFYKNDKEIGRYVEYARETLEKDILKILKGKPYKHSYDKS